MRPRRQNRAPKSTISNCADNWKQRRFTESFKPVIPKLILMSAAQRDKSSVKCSHPHFSARWKPRLIALTFFDDNEVLVDTL